MLVTTRSCWGKLLFRQIGLISLQSSSLTSSSQIGDLLETAEGHKLSRDAVQRQLFYDNLKRRRYEVKKRLKYSIAPLYKPHQDAVRILSTFESVPDLPHVEGEILFGIHPVLLALQSSYRRISRLYLKLRELTDEGEELNTTDNVKIILKLSRDKSIPTSIVTLKVLDSLSRNRPHQGVCLDVSPIDYVKLDEEQLSELLESAVSVKDTSIPPVILYLDKVLDVMNFGAIMRTAYYMGVDYVFVQEGRCAKISPTASKASSGVLELMPVYQVANGKSFLEICKENKFKIVGTSQPNTVKSQSSQSVDEFKLDSPTVLIMGNEGVGIAEELTAECNSFLSVPPRRVLQEGVGSLNVSVAAAILLHSITRPS